MSRVYKNQLAKIKCPICGQELNSKYIESDTEFDYSDYYCDNCEINLTIYCHLEEDDTVNNRINAIANFAQKREEEKVAKERALQQQIEEHIRQVRELKPRIDELIAVGNACLKHNIPLTGSAWGGHEGYDTHQFFTNCWSHLVGFVKNNDNTITHLGIYAGGACGLYDFLTDGFEVYDQHEQSHERVTPNICHLKEFLEDFDTFESELYKYVDKVTQ